MPNGEHKIPHVEKELGDCDNVDCEYYGEYWWCYLGRHDSCFKYHAYIDALSKGKLEDYEY